MMLSNREERRNIDLGGVRLTGDLVFPERVHALVIFAHGSGSSRLSPRNVMVAQYLNKHGLATFLFDLLSEDEDRERSHRFNIRMLADRLMEVTEWVINETQLKGMPIGYFGASTGAAAALIAAAESGRVAAVVSRGGRPDLALSDLLFVKAPTLLIVGEQDKDVLRLNQEAYAHLNGVKKLELIAGATHLFEEEGAMEKVCVLAAHWFDLYLQPHELHR